MIRTLSDKATLMGLEFGALDRMGMNQDPPPLTHTQVLDVQLRRKRKKKKREREKKKVAGLQYQKSPEEGAQGRDTPGAKSRKVFLSLLGQLFLLTLGLSLLATSFRK